MAHRRRSRTDSLTNRRRNHVSQAGTEPRDIDVIVRRPLLAFLFVVTAAPLSAQTVSFDKAVYTFQEAAGVGLVTATRTGDPSMSLSVPYHSEIDTSIVDRTITFQPNETTKSFSVTVPNDGVYDQWSHGF